MPARPKPRKRGTKGAPDLTVVPLPPSWLPENARPIFEAMARDMIAAETWQPVFTPTLATLAILEAEFREDPKAFTAAKLSQKRLLANDLGLSPSTVGKLQRAPRPQRQPRESDPDSFDDL